MPPPTAPRPDPKAAVADTEDEDDLEDGEESEVIEGPPGDEDVWDRYNKRLEFPLATVAAVFLHIVVGVVLLVVLARLMDSGEDRSGPELKLMQVGGFDDSGDGSAGSGGKPDPDVVKDVDPVTAAEKSFATPEALADAKADLTKLVLEDPTGKMPISAPNAQAYKELDESLRKKLLGVGSRKGEGPGDGSGYDGTPGKGPGGTGADSTRARGLRWVLRFRVAGGKDYVEQLQAMGAEVLIPLPPDDKKCIIIKDLSNPGAQTVASDSDLRRLAGKIQFADNRREQVRDVLATLGVNAPGQPKAFWAFFPKNMEDDLARKETNYRNRRAEEIEETIFQVTMRGGKFEITVVDQVRKK